MNVQQQHQPPAMDYNSNSYITYTAPAPVNLSNLPAAMSSPVEVQPVGKVGELDDSHLLCIFNQPSSSSASPSETVLQVKAWLEQQEQVHEVEYMQPKRRVKRGMEEL